VRDYNPANAPDPAEWLALDEQERIALAETYHLAAKIKLPNITAHAAFHVVIENQIAEGVQSTLRAMDRLVKEGLSRHDAVHAVATVVIEHLNKLMKAKGSDVDAAQASYDAAVDRLSAKQWRRKYGK
jgi:membrane carboxypeptidase/penicillin-binding protein PbpC